MKILNKILTATAVSACVMSAEAGQPVANDALPSSRSSVPIPGQYIIRFKSHFADHEREGPAIALQAGGQVMRQFRNAFKGAVIRIPEHTSVSFENALRRHPEIEYVEQDATVHAYADSIQSASPSWGLDRIDQRDSLPASVNNYSYSYRHTANNVNVFVIDSGIRASHVEFLNPAGSASRVTPGVSFVPDNQGSNDCHGHGTHVAGTVGGRTAGVAKDVTLIPVRVLDCDGAGSWSRVIAGLDWVAQWKELNPNQAAVANLSLGGSKSAAVNAAVANLVGKGVTAIVAAGNDKSNACNFSPASAPSAITVGATDRTDTRATWSNYGSCLALFAPGTTITSAWNTDDRASHTVSGTSMAAPHVAGVAALALAVRNDASPAAVLKFIADNAMAGVVRNPGTGSPTGLAYSLAMGGPPVEPGAHVSQLRTSVRKTGTTSWTATVSVTVADNANQAITGALVTGSFANDGVNRTCTTDSQGSCPLVSASLNYRNTRTVSFTLGNVRGFLKYNPAQNTASANSTVTIWRP